MTAAIIQARLGSSRFPNKTLAMLKGKPLIWHVFERVMTMRGLDAVAIACPSKYDATELASAIGVHGLCMWYRSSIAEMDLLGRYAACAESLRADTVIRVTADCPLWDPKIGEEVLALYQSDPHCEYASNIAPGYVDGEDVEIFSASALRWANREAKQAYDREHCTPWLRRNVKCLTLPPLVNRAGEKTSVDTPEDLAALEAR